MGVEAARRFQALAIPELATTQELTISSLIEANAAMIADDEAVVTRAKTMANMSDEARSGIDLTALRIRRYADRRVPAA